MANLPEPFILDANIFVQASRNYYALDFAKPFWDGLVQFAEEGRILSIDKVYDELMKGNDLLKDWADTEFKSFFKEAETTAVTEHYRDLILWAESESKYEREAKDKFMLRANADAWVIGYAKAHTCTVVTSEALDAKTRVSIKIPNVCDAFKIPYCDTYKLIRQLQFSF